MGEYLQNTVQTRVTVNVAYRGRDYKGVYQKRMKHYNMNLTKRDQTNKRSKQDTKDQTAQHGGN